MLLPTIVVPSPGIASVIPTRRPQPTPVGPVCFKSSPRSFPPPGGKSSPLGEPERAEDDHDAHGSRNCHADGHCERDEKGRRKKGHEVDDLDHRVEGRTQVSLRGSPTVSPMTEALCASDPLPPYRPSSIVFFALSHAPPEKVAMKTASSWPERMTPARKPPRASTCRRSPTAMGRTPIRANGMSSRCAALVHRDTVWP